MEHLDITGEKEKSQRPTFLTVLCILTFVGSGWGLLANIFQLMTAGLTDSVMQMEQFSTMQGNLPGEGAEASFMQGFLESSMAVMEATVLHFREIYASNVVLSLISLVGAVMMFCLRRRGFYVYTAAQILMLFIMPYYAGFSTVIVIGFVWNFFVAGAFVAMYGMNLKHMR